MTRSSGDGSQPARQPKKSKQTRGDSSAADLDNLGPIIEETPAAINSTESETPGSHQMEPSVLERLEVMIRDLQGSNERLRQDHLAAQETSAREINFLKEQLHSRHPPSPSVSVPPRTDTPLRPVNAPRGARAGQLEGARVSFLDVDGVVHSAEDTDTEEHGISREGNALAGLFRELNDRLRKVETGNTKSTPSLGMAKKPVGPFTKRIHDHNRDFKNLKMDSYTGKEDPVMHATAFQSAYNGKGYTDEDWCHAFVNTLTQEAMLWFYQLEPESIDSYEQLVEAFTTEYATKSSFFYSVGELTGFQQGTDERLADYMERFKTAYRRCTTKDDIRAAQIFRDGLVPGEFLRKLNSTNAVLTFTELMNRANQYARSYYLTYERKSQLNAMHKASATSASTTDPTGEKRKQEQVPTSRTGDARQNDKRYKGNSYRGNRDRNWGGREGRRYDPPRRENQSHQNQEARNPQHQPVYQLGPGYDQPVGQAYPSRQDAWHTRLPQQENSYFPQELAPYNQPTGVNHVNDSSWGWTETGYNRYPKGKKFQDDQ